jgi:hypothetical protein
MLIKMDANLVMELAGNECMQNFGAGGRRVLELVVI